MSDIRQATVADLLRHLSGLMRGLSNQAQSADSAAQMAATADRADELLWLLGGA
jgi:CubicO group peptidase (beta-lactamase class C family)